MPLLIEPPKPKPLRPPLGNHCRVCGVSLKGTGRRRNRYCVAHKGSEKVIWERKHRAERLAYFRNRHSKTATRFDQPEDMG